MRRDPEFFGDIDLPLLYIAKKLRDSLEIERLFTASELDYLVEPDTYRGGIIFQSERIGAFFYTAPADEEKAREVLSRAGFKPYQPD